VHDGIILVSVIMIAQLAGGMTAVEVSERNLALNRERVNEEFRGASSGLL
jgi:hypothetical protein